jgi:CRP-like cAMP-binding protein
MSFMDHLAPEARQRLEQVAERILVPPRQVVIHKGETDGDFYRIEQGTLEVVDTSARPELVLDVLGPGTVVGEMAFLTGDPRSADVRAGVDCVLLRWAEDALHQELRNDAQLASAFYRASARLLSRRLRQLTAAAAGGGLSGSSDRAAVPEEVRGARALADRVKTELLQLEPQVRGAAQVQDGRRVLEPTWTAFLDSGRRLFKALPPSDRRRAGELLAKELNPYLTRSRLAELAMRRERGRTGDPALLAHVETAQAQGSDPLGVALDATLQQSATVVALRDRIGPTIDALEDALPGRAARVLVLNAGAGTTVARLVPLMSATGGEITVVDGDREALAFLNSASAAPIKVRIRLVAEDLARICLDRSEVHLGPHDLVLVDGLLEYMPDRALATLLPALRRQMPGRAQLVLNLLSPSDDAFVFDHLLGWPTLRRDPASVVQLLEHIGFEAVTLRYASGAGAVIQARTPGTLTGL